MMREIKFRGKRNGKWVYGGFHKHQKITVCPITLNEEKQQEIKYAHLIIESGFSDWNMPRPLWAHEVDPETVGQYTGLKDKNGTEIYEGDIVKAKDPYKLNSKERFYTCEVVFTDGALFMLKHKTVEWGKEEVHYYSMRIMEIEVIGNIYENLELLKGDDNDCPGGGCESTGIVN